MQIRDEVPEMFSECRRCPMLSALSRSVKSPPSLLNGGVVDSPGMRTELLGGLATPSEPLRVVMQSRAVPRGEHSSDASAPLRGYDQFPTSDRNFQRDPTYILIMDFSPTASVVHRPPAGARTGLLCLNLCFHHGMHANLAVMRDRGATTSSKTAWLICALAAPIFAAIRALI